MQQANKKKYLNPFTFLFTRQNKSTPTNSEQLSKHDLFGLSLCDAVKSGSILWGLKVPDPVALCFTEISERGLMTEGIFRLSGSVPEVDSLERIINSCTPTERKLIDVSQYDIHALSSLVKRYLSKLPEPVIPVTFHEAILTASHDLNDLASLLSRLPSSNRQLLHAILILSSHIQRHTDQNMMNSEALATVLAPVCVGFEKRLDEQTHAIHEHNHTSVPFRLFKSSSSSTISSKKKHNKYTDLYNPFNNQNMIQQQMRRTEAWKHVWTVMIENHTRLLNVLDEQHSYFPSSQFRSLPSPFSTQQQQQYQQQYVKSPSEIMMDQFEPMGQYEPDTFIPVANKKNVKFFTKNYGIHKKDPDNSEHA
ncbi:MAG: Rho GTPase activation protein [Benjaminiella poitrasii]|nr:MAG: Rho GTPase activation protein [Benjaminiella poitrasii]